MIDLHELNQSSGEVGYWLSRDVQHLGIMTKSVEFLVEYAFKQLNLEFLILRTAQDNLASQHVAQRAGFEYVNPSVASATVPVVFAPHHPVVVYARTG